MSAWKECSIINFMKTKIIQIDKNQLNMGIIKEAGDILKKGGLVAFPTETVYGLGANALDEQASGKIYEAKGRPSDNPLIVHIARLEDLHKITARIPEIAYKIADKYWPGPLTMIFEKNDIVPDGTTGGLASVAVRMPGDAAARALITAGGGYIAAPSANTSGRPSPTTAQHVEEDLSGKIELIIDGGSVEIGLESTIIDMTVHPPMILRPGAVTQEMLEELIGEVVMDKGVMDADSKEAPKAPGMKYRHYAPNAKLYIIEGAQAEVIFKINELTLNSQKEGKKVGIIGTEESMFQYKQGTVKSIGTRADETTIASRLYAVLRDFDADKVDVIYSESFVSEGIGSAVMNRLLKAAGQHIIKA